MGKKKLAVIDDSVAPVEEAKPERKKVNPNPELLEKERAQARLDAKKVNPNPELEVKNVEVKEESVNEQPEQKLDESASQTESKKKTSPDSSKKNQGEPKYRSNKYKEASEKVEKSKRYSIDAAVDLAKETSYSKFGGSLEIHINTSQKNLRGLVALPFASGKKLKIVAFGKGAAESGADIVGDDEKLNEIAKGKIDFDFIVTTPEWMPKLARAAKILGPRGLMPNPKNGTISDDLKKAVSEIQSGKVEYKTEKAANVIHLSLGSVSQPTEELSANIKMLLSTIGKTKIKIATISPSMGPGVKLDLSSL